MRAMALERENPDRERAMPDALQLMCARSGQADGSPQPGGRSRRKVQEDDKWARGDTARQHSDRRASCSGRFSALRKLLAPAKAFSAFRKHTENCVCVGCPSPTLGSPTFAVTPHTHGTHTRRDARGGPWQGHGVYAHRALVEAPASPRCGAYVQLPLRGTRKKTEGYRRKLAGVGTL